MRSRTELITTTLDDSDAEEELSDFDDSEEDWKPEETKVKRARLGTKRLAGGKKSRSAKKVKRKPTKRAKNDSSSSSEDTSSSGSALEEPKSRGNEINGKQRNKTETSLSVQKPLQRQTLKIKNVPDKNGVFDLLVNKDDLKEGVRDNEGLCLWRRDGTSLLQKYIRDSDSNGNDNEIIFVFSSVYSCWLENDRDLFCEVKVKCYGDENHGKVRILDVNALEDMAEHLRDTWTSGKDDENSPAAESNEDDIDDDGDNTKDDEDDDDDENESNSNAKKDKKPANDKVDEDEDDDNDDEDGDVDDGDDDNDDPDDDEEGDEDDDTNGNRTVKK